MRTESAINADARAIVNRLEAALQREQDRAGPANLNSSISGFSA